MFPSENHLSETEDEELERTITIFLKESKEFKEDTNKQISEHKENTLERMLA